MQDKLIKDLLVSIAFIAKIVIGIVWKVKGIFTPGIGWVILLIAAAIFVPMGFTICFIRQFLYRWDLQSVSLYAN